MKHKANPIRWAKAEFSTSSFYDGGRPWLVKVGKVTVGLWLTEGLARNTASDLNAELLRLTRQHRKRRRSR